MTEKSRDLRETLKECREGLLAAEQSARVLRDPKSGADQAGLARRALNDSLRQIESAARRAREGLRA